MSASPAAEPPPSGLGNFKGVMLCNRPDDIRADAGPAPFKSTVAATYSDQLGLNPTQKEPRQDQVKKNLAVSKHCAWLKQLEAQMKVQRRLEGEEQQAEEAKHAKVKAFCEQGRTEVRKMREENERVYNEQEEAKRQAARAKKAAAEEAKEAKPPAKEKPKWAMTAGEADKMGEDEKEELLDFAEELNFEQFMDDLEFKEMILALRDRSGKIARDQDKFREALCEQLNACPPEDDSQSVAEAVSQREGSQRASQRDASEWDASTCTSEQSAMTGTTSQSIAAKIREQNSDMRSVHSQRSLQAIIERQQAAKAEE
jgi:hypothetical protein